MIRRFTQDPKKRLLLEAISNQAAVRGDMVIARAIADVAEIVEVPAGSQLIQQGADDNEIFFVVGGAFGVRVDGRLVAERRVGQHVGEMSVIAPSARRSASVIALETSVVAKVTEPAFAALARQFPELWRNLAAELADRLRQRNRFVRPVNDQPNVFIGSSVEGLDVARALQSGFSHDPFVVRTWTERVFTASQVSIEALEQHAAAVDFAVIVLKPDDVVEIRGNRVAAPRDNVIFELGLFMGSLGRMRSYLVYPQQVDIRLPTDLLGVTPLTYQPYRNENELTARIGPVCNAIRSQIRLLGPR